MRTYRQLGYLRNPPNKGSIVHVFQIFLFSAVLIKVAHPGCFLRRISTYVHVEPGMFRIPTQRAILFLNFCRPNKLNMGLSNDACHMFCMSTNIYCRKTQISAFFPLI